jgi:hypothetical protein
MSNTEKENKIVKALLIGMISGLLFGLTGEQWNFEVRHNFVHYGSVQAIIVGILVALFVFWWNNQEEE